MSFDSAASASTAAPRGSVATRARLYLVGGAMLALVVAFGVFVLAWGQYSISQRTAELARQTSALAKGQAIGDRFSLSAEETATAASRDRLLRIGSSADPQRQRPPDSSHHSHGLISLVTPHRWPS